MLKVFLGHYNLQSLHKIYKMNELHFSPLCRAAPRCVPKLEVVFRPAAERKYYLLLFQSSTTRGWQGSNKSSNRDTYKSTMTQIEEIEEIILNIKHGLHRYLEDFLDNIYIYMVHLY